ncbi:E3 ubiquitin-protein ligase PUB23-like [Glycine soja]|uniref:U-box domain-containing protein n=1 Tax=Glycine soja TaxID=3848 RepID=A0A445ICP4_GLYSO|nr:E3 ubiquitin-protein ligase PUB23-like [Glycine soja]KHN36500.1 E3 ubiquitin-protein ligase PUB23 [Glycine soja]RZB83752.1 E3 ubiquitin-protein ligase PUB23 [Glycine soja]
MLYESDIMTEIETPQFFLCPISLQIMKDPVTTVTGITYDRESIEQWLLKAKDCTCPITKQRLPRSTEFLTPNHTLRRLIQAWCSANEANGVDQIPTPKSPLSIANVEKLVKDLEVSSRFQRALEKLHDLAIENGRNRRCMASAGVAEAMVHVITKSFIQGNKTTSCVEEALKILGLLWSSANNMVDNDNMKRMVGENFDFLNSLTWVLQLQTKNNVKVINEAMPILKLTIEAKDSTPLGNLKLEFFKVVVSVMKNRELTQQAVKSALHVLIETCPLGRNRMKIVEAGAVVELIELALEKPEKNMTELIFILLAHLCSCADGREQFLQHAAGIAVVSKRILRVSPTTDDRALHIFSLVSKFSASNEVVQEMLRVGAVSKLCMVLQADCASYLKEKARGVLRLHSKTWNNSPCIQVYLLTRFHR